MLKSIKNIMGILFLALVIIGLFITLKAYAGAPADYDGTTSYTISQSEVDACLAKYSTTYPTQPSGHPRIFITSSTKSAFISRVQHSKLSDLYEEVINDSNYSTNGDIGSSTEPNFYDDNVRKCIEANAFRYLIEIENEEIYSSKAINCALNYLVNQKFIVTDLEAGTWTIELSSSGSQQGIVTEEGGALYFTGHGGSYTLYQDCSLIGRSIS